MMSRRAVRIFLVILFALWAAALPSGNTTVVRAQQEQPVMEEPPPDDGNPYTNEFSGHYWSGGQYVDLQAYSVKSDPYYVLTPEGEWEERVDFRYADSDMYRSGNTLSYSVRETDRPSGYDWVYVTVGGTTVPFNINAEEEGSLTEEQAAQLYAWMEGPDGLRVQETSAAMLQQGMPADSDQRLNYNVVGIFVDLYPPPETGRNLDQKGRPARAAYASFKPALAAPGSVAFTNACWAPANNLTSSGNLLRLAGMPMQCYGCCGLGCYCARNRCGGVISGGPCRIHDACTRFFRNPFHPFCLPSLGAAIRYTVSRFFTC